MDTPSWDGATKPFTKYSDGVNVGRHLAIGRLPLEGQASVLLLILEDKPQETGLMVLESELEYPDGVDDLLTRLKEEAVNRPNSNDRKRKYQKKIGAVKRSRD